MPTFARCGGGKVRKIAEKTHIFIKIWVKSGGLLLKMIKMWVFGVLRSG
jgi:hypothetical protein